MGIERFPTNYPCILGNFTNNETNILNTIREEQESRFSSFTNDPELIPQAAVPPELANLDIQHETEMFAPLTEPGLSVNDGRITDNSEMSIVPAALKPKVFMNSNESSGSFFSIGSDATSTPLHAINIQPTAKPPSTLMEESVADDSNQHVQNGFIGETPRRRSQDNNIRPPPVRRISQESSEDDETPFIDPPEGSVERAMREVYGDHSQSAQDLDELAERVGHISSSSDSEASKDGEVVSSRDPRRKANLPARRKSSYVISEILDEIQEEANTSNKENSLPSPQRTLEEDTSPSDDIPPQKSLRQPVNDTESPPEVPASQGSTTFVVEDPKTRRGRPRMVAEIKSDDEDEPPKKIQKSPPKKTKKSPPKKLQKSPLKKTQKSTPKKVAKSPAKTLKPRNGTQKHEESDSEEEVLPVKRSKSRRRIVEQSSSDEEEFKDAQADVEENSPEDNEAALLSADNQHEALTRKCSVELDQLTPSKSMLEAFKQNYELPEATNSERASSVETVADSENGDAIAATKRPPPRKRDLSTDSERSEASSTASSVTSMASTVASQASTSRKRKSKVEPPRKSRPPRRKARLAPGSLVERSLKSKIRRSK